MKVTRNSWKREKCVEEIVVLHQLVWQAIEEGRVDTLQPDPTYSRARLFEDALVERIVAKIEARLYGYELRNYLGYHYNAQGVQNSEVLVTPGFDQIPLSAKRFLVLGMDEIYQRYKA